MAHHDHFNCCIEVALPNHATDPAHVFHYESGAVAPNISDAELDKVISKLLVQLGHTPGTLWLSVETILSKGELAGPCLPPDQTPTFALMHRRIDFIRRRFANHGLPASRLAARIL